MLEMKSKLSFELYLVPLEEAETSLRFSNMCK